VKAKPLGPLQGAWDAWESHTEYIHGLKPAYFQTIILAQLVEVQEHLSAHEDTHAAKEVIDIISVCLNWLRSMHLNDSAIAALICERTRTRYTGQTADIMKKYRKYE
jgi:hypothetical protein